MFSRRLLRIKVLQTLYAYHKIEGKTYVSTEKNLLYSLEKSYELYHLLLLLIIDVVDFTESRMQQALEKHLPTERDLKQNSRFIDNQLVAQLRQNTQLRSYLASHPVSWVNNPEIIRKLYEIIIDADFFLAYMESDKKTYQADRLIVEQIYFAIVMNFEDLYLNLEEQSIFWIDDVDFIIKMIVKTLKKFSPEQEEGGELLPMFKEKDDLTYVKKLLRRTIKNEQECLDMIKSAANNWELDRIAFTDNLIMQMAITEAMEFPSIPVKVTINEFIEIAKLYSTHKSSQFINGILDNVIGGLRKEGKIVKKGRGLIGDV
jgi:transcription antitermination protein NusB